MENAASASRVFDGEPLDSQFRASPGSGILLDHQTGISATTNKHLRNVRLGGLNIWQMKRTKVKALSSKSRVSSQDKVRDRAKVKNRVKVRAKVTSNGVATPEVNSRMKVKKKENRRNTPIRTAPQRKIRGAVSFEAQQRW